MPFTRVTLCWLTTIREVEAKEVLVSKLVMSAALRKLARRSVLRFEDFSCNVVRGEGSPEEDADAAELGVRHTRGR